jgi:hypothetical protein
VVRNGLVWGFQARSWRSVGTVALYGSGGLCRSWSVGVPGSARCLSGSNLPPQERRRGVGSPVCAGFAASASVMRPAGVEACAVALLLAYVLLVETLGLLLVTT